MKLYIIKRVAAFVAVLIGVSMLSFLLIAFSGKDPAEVIARRGDLNATTELISRFAWKWNLMEVWRNVT